MELARAGVRVVTVCPGRVRTQFHQVAYRDGQSLPDIFRRRQSTGISAEAVARATLRALRRGRREVVVPWRLGMAAGFRRLFPRLADKAVARLLR
jgi:short-subunit dehydrogenase